MKVVQLQQRTAGWHIHRAQHRNASDAPVVMGLSPYKTRSALMHELHTGIEVEVDAGTQARFDDGHRCEALARPLAEEFIGDELFPVVGVEGVYSASFDGLTMMGDTSWEHKRLNMALRQSMEPGATGADLPEMYRIQMEHQCLVSGATRVLFTASEWNPDGTVRDIRHVWYTPDADLRARLVASWDQFAADLVTYTPPEVVEKAVAAPIQALPALVVRVTGEVTSSNLPAFKAAAETFIARIKTDLSTDNDFADAAETVKFCKDAEDRLELAKTQALEQTASVAELLRTVEHISAQFRAKRLELDKLVTRRKDEIKADIVTKARTAYATFLAALNAELSPVSLVLSQPDFVGAAKGKRTVATLQDAVDGELAAAKIAANEAARLMRVKLAWFKASAAEFGYLFHDIQGLAQKPVEDFQLAVQARIDAHQAAEAQRKAEAERVTAEAMQKAAAIPAPVQVPAPTASVTPIRQAAPAADEPAVLNLGEVCAWLGVSMTAADIATRFGIEPAARVKAACRYRMSDAERIRAALVKHLQALAPLRAAA